MAIYFLFFMAISSCDQAREKLTEKDLLKYYLIKHAMPQDAANSKIALFIKNHTYLDDDKTMIEKDNLQFARNDPVSPSDNDIILSSCEISLNGDEIVLEFMLWPEIYSKTGVARGITREIIYKTYSEWDDDVNKISSVVDGKVVALTEEEMFQKRRSLHEK